MKLIEKEIVIRRGWQYFRRTFVRRLGVRPVFLCICKNRNMGKQKTQIFCRVSSARFGPSVGLMIQCRFNEICEPHGTEVGTNELRTFCHRHQYIHPAYQ